MNRLLVLVFLVVGIVMALLVKEIGSKNIPLQRTFVNANTLYNQELEVDNLKVKNEMLSKKMLAEQNRLATYEEATKEASEEGSVTQTVDQYLNEELPKHQMANGSVSIMGPGLVITLQDSDKTIEPGENPNKYLVHNSDVLAIINELKVAGAEGIQLNNIRLTNRSNIDCGGAVINVDGEISTPPFIIEAIGDPELMYIYLNSDESVIQLLKYWEIKVNIEKSENLLLNNSNKL